jgi:carbonic anhydrase
MQKLVQGIHHFQANIFRSHKELFERLAAGQSPETLFITCSDSRINPNLFTQTAPGDLFILRNAGNLVPPYGAANGGAEATVEFAVVALKVKDVVICGHSHCAVVKGLLHPETLAGMPAMAAWLSHAEATRRIMREKYPDRTGLASLTTAVEENVLVQIENLRTHPAVAARLAAGKLKIHGWVYKIETGEIFAYESGHGQFVPVTGAPPHATNGRGRQPAA